jgi:hypothetical protein
MVYISLKTLHRVPSFLPSSSCAIAIIHFTFIYIINFTISPLYIYYKLHIVSQDSFKENFKRRKCLLYLIICFPFVAHFIPLSIFKSFSIWYHFSSALRPSFNISGSAGLLYKNNLAFV